MFAIRQTFSGRRYYGADELFEHRTSRREAEHSLTDLEASINYRRRACYDPGQFVVPPAKAEEMYTPETFGRTGTDFLTVE